MASPRRDPLEGEYKIKCTNGDCHGVATVYYNLSCGWKIGMLIPKDPSNPIHGRCHVCKLYKMQVISQPPPPMPILPKGFSRVPEK